MKLSDLKVLANAKFGRAALKLSKHSPTILFAAGVVGVGATVVLATRAGRKMDQVLDDQQTKIEEVRKFEADNYSDEDRKKDLLVTYALCAREWGKLYGPTFLVGAVSIAALTGSHVVLNRRYAGAVAAYAALNQAFRGYRSRVVAELGEDKDKQFRYNLVEKEIVEETEDGPVTKKVLVAGGGTEAYDRFFDESSSEWNKERMYNQFFLSSQQSYMNDLLNTRGHVFLNEVYTALGLEHSKAGAVVGWVKGNPDGDGYIDFGVFEGRENAGMVFVTGNERSVKLSFNVDGNILDLI